MIARKAGFGYGFGVYDLPYVVRIGVSEGSLTVVVDAEHPDHETSYDIVPDTLDESFEGLPKLAEHYTR